MSQPASVIKLSMMSYTVSRQPEHFDLEKMLALTRELDLAGIDFVGLHDMDPRDLRKAADDHGVPVICHTFQARLDQPDGRAEALERCRRGCEAAAILGAPLMMIPTPGRQDVERATQRQRWIEGLKEAAPLASKAGLTLTIENFPGEASPFVTADDVLQAINQVPGLKLTFDNGNAATGPPRAGFSDRRARPSLQGQRSARKERARKSRLCLAAESFRRCAEHVVHAHFKDWDVRDDPAEGYRRMLDGRYYRAALIGEGCVTAPDGTASTPLPDSEPGVSGRPLDMSGRVTGCVDHKACLAAMKAAGYGGCINIEYEANKYDPHEATRRAADYLRGLWADLPR